MDKLKEYWFACSNIVVFIGILVYYFIAVAGYAPKIEKLNSDIDSEIRVMMSLANQKKTARWTTWLNSNKTELESQNQIVDDFYDEAEGRFEKYFDAQGKPDHDSIQISLSIFKNQLLNKWDQLEDRYSPEEVSHVESISKQRSPGRRRGTAKEDRAKFIDRSKEEKFKGFPFVCEREIIRKIQPDWLRGPRGPRKDQARSAQKEYWLTQEILKVLESQDIVALSKIEIQELKSDSFSVFDKKALWQLRDVEIDVVVPYRSPMKIFSAFNQHPFLWRVVGFEQNNINSAPPDVENTAHFIHFTIFDQEPRVRLKIVLRHFDLLTDEEQLKEKAKK